ncbi:MAG: L-lactate permease [Planctomycetota bacterium]
MPQWTQVYAPILDDRLLSAAVAALPVVVLLGLLAFSRVQAHIAALLGLITALAVAILAYQMPIPLAAMAAVHGALYGLLPIGWIVLNAIFIYDLTVTSGDFTVLRNAIGHFSSDRRIQALLIAFSFGAFIEGAAGFGTPVAISAAMLIGLGFRPLEAAGLALIGNTAPVAFGALGTPLIALASVTGLPLESLSAAAGRILPFFSLLIPFWLVWVMAGRKAMLEIWPACLVVGGSFAITQFLVSNFHGPWLVDIVSAIISMLALCLLLRYWSPREVWTFVDEQAGSTAELKKAADFSRPKGDGGVGAVSRSRLVAACLPWVLLSVFVFAWGVPQVKQFLNGGTSEAPNLLQGISKLEFPVYLLHDAVVRVPPVVASSKPEPAIFKFDWLAATGTSLLLAGIVSGLCRGFGLRQLGSIYWRTVKRVKFSLLTIAAMLALGFVTKAAGIDATMGLAFASTGALFPFFSAMLGWLGVALTGSDTSSNVLFGGLQKITAEQLGLNPILTAAGNTTGGVMGKMIDAQSLVVASVATGRHDSEGEILRYVFWHSIVLAAMVGGVIMAYARLLPDWIPK